MSMSMKGLDSFFFPPGERTAVDCQVCGSRCDVTRNVKGPTGFAEAMGGGKHLHDAFCCPHRDEEWHQKALKLKEAINAMPSPSLVKIMEKDLEKMVRERY
jgi:hypothetical protein